LNWLESLARCPPPRLRWSVAGREACRSTLSGIWIGWRNLQRGWAGSPVCICSATATAELVCRIWSAMPGRPPGQSYWVDGSHPNPLTDLDSAADGVRMKDLPPALSDSGERLLLREAASTSHSGLRNRPRKSICCLQAESTLDLSQSNKCKISSSTLRERFYNPQSVPFLARRFDFEVHYPHRESPKNSKMLSRERSERSTPKEQPPRKLSGKRTANSNKLLERDTHKVSADGITISGKHTEGAH
jgi:hypothetical protein